MLMEALHSSRYVPQYDLLYACVVARSLCSCFLSIAGTALVSGASVSRVSGPTWIPNLRPSIPRCIMTLHNKSHLGYFLSVDSTFRSFSFSCLFLVSSCLCLALLFCLWWLFGSPAPLSDVAPHWLTTYDGLFNLDWVQGAIANAPSLSANWRIPPAPELCCYNRPFMHHRHKELNCILLSRPAEDLF